MQITYEGPLAFVNIHIDELLELYHKNRGGDYDYFCVMVRVEVERVKSKRSYTETFHKLNRGNKLFSADIQTSANMCFEMLEIAGLSKKGQARFRQYCRLHSDYVFEGNRVVETYGVHLSIDEIQDAACQEEDTFVCTPFVSRMREQGEGDIRLGILREIQKRKPDYVASFIFHVDSLAAVNAS